MRHLRHLVGFLLVFATATAGCASDSRPPLSQDRGLSYDAFYLPFDVSQEQIRDELTGYQQLGATRIYFTCSEADLDRDHKVQAVLSAAHGLGLAVFANPYFAGVFSGDEGDTARLYLALHPGDREISRRGQQSSVPAYNSPMLRLYLKEQLRRLLGYDFDGLILDEPRFPEPDAPDDYFPYDDASRASFATQFGRPMPDAEEQSVESFRQSSMLAFLRELTDFAKSVRPNLHVALTVLPVADPALPDRRGTGSWPALAAIPTLDSLQSDPYWPAWGLGFDFFEQNVDRLLTAVAGSAATAGIWVQAYSLPAADSATISQGLRYARSRHIPSISAWLSPQFPNGDEESVRKQLADGFR